MSELKDWMKREKFSVLAVACFIALVGFVYFGLQGERQGMVAGPGGQISTDGNAIFALASGGDLKLFILQQPGEKLPGSLELAEGKFSDYKTHDLVGKIFYPVILGFSEAEKLRGAGVFNSLGDSFEMFGKNFIVVGILEKTGNALDFAELVPLGEEQIKEGQ